jgi:TolB-like protein
MHSRACFFILIALFFLFSGSACKTSPSPLQEQEPSKPKINTKSPDWVLGKSHPDYPREQYLVGVGFSNFHSGSAKDSARSNLAKTLKVKVRATMVDIATKENSHIESVIETEVDTVLQGVEIKDGWLDQVKGVYYALAVVERNLAAFRVQDEIDKIESVLKRNLNEGDEAAKKGDIINALSGYLSGYQKASALPPLYSALHIITSDNKYTETQNISAGNFESKVKRMVQDLNLTTVSGDRQIVKTWKGLTEPLVAKIFIGKGEEWAPASNVPVIFYYETGEGELEKEKTSGPDGTIQTTVHKIASYKEANHIISVKLDYVSILAKINGDFAEKLLSPLKTKSAAFNYAIQTPKWGSNKPQVWKDSITDLSNQVISNIPPGKVPVLGVLPFKDLRANRFTPFSQVLNEDIKVILARAEDLKLKEIKIEDNKSPEEIAQANGLDYYINGSYRMEKTGLEIRSLLIETQTKNIQSSANIIIQRKELNPHDLELIDTFSEEFKTAQRGKSYQEYLEKVVAAKPLKSAFDVEIHTDKKNYEINNNIVFQVTSDKNGYLTMLDINPDGNLCVVFPNYFHPDSFIRAGEINQIPPKNKFKLEVRGPSGLERIKVFVTLNKVSLLQMNLSERQPFHCIKKKMMQGNKAVESLSKKVDSIDNSEWSEAYSEIFIFKTGKTYKRESRKISILGES